MERRQRFRQEAMLAAAFNHPNIATVHDVGEQDGVTYIVMELVRGKSLRSLVRDEPLEIGRAIDIATGIAGGLAKAHREGVLHRDLKPDNVVLTDDGVPKILDFGLGKLIGDADPEGGGPLTEAPTVTAQTSPYITRAGQVIGTLAYMSPEQVHGRPVDARSDVFSFGVLLYEMLSGTRPFAGESRLDTATAILRDEPPPLEELRRDVPSGLQAILARCLEKAPEQRFASGQELHDALLALKRQLEAPAAGFGSLLRRPAVLGAARPAPCADRRRNGLGAPPQLAGVVGPQRGAARDRAAVQLRATRTAPCGCSTRRPRSSPTIPTWWSSSKTSGYRCRSTPTRPAPSSGSRATTTPNASGFDLGETPIEECGRRPARPLPGREGGLRHLRGCAVRRSH